MFADLLNSSYFALFLIVALCKFTDMLCFATPNNSIAKVHFLFKVP